MTQEDKRYLQDKLCHERDKELLLKDLSARLPYGVVIQTWYDKRINIKCVGVNVYSNVVELDIPEDDEAKVFIDNVKPYLFPISSMTEEQKKDIFCNGTFFISNRNELGRFPKHSDDYDYVTIDDYLMIYKKLIENHFDVNGLIEKGLAIDATGLNIY